MGRNRRPQGKRIFQIAYTPNLMLTRELLLKQRGYEVTSALGNAQAMKLLESGDPPHFFLVGHDNEPSERIAMVQWLNARFPQVKVLALNSPHHRLQMADYNVVMNGPEEWLNIIASAI